MNISKKALGLGLLDNCKATLIFLQCKDFWPMQVSEKLIVFNLLTTLKLLKAISKHLIITISNRNWNFVYKFAHSPTWSVGEDTNFFKSIVRILYKWCYNYICTVIILYY